MIADNNSVLIVGGGLAGLAAAAAFGDAGYRVQLIEARPFLGGRAASYPLPNIGATIDNCQHVLLRCCSNLLDFYARLGVQRNIQFHREFYWIEPGGRLSVMKRGALPAPAHFTESFLRLHFLDLKEKLGVARAMLSIRSEYRQRNDLDEITMADWLAEKRQPPKAVERFWRQVLVSAINEDLERMSALHGLQVFFHGFLETASSYEMGVPSVPLSELYAEEAWSRYPNVEIRLREPADEIVVQDGLVQCVKSGEHEFSAAAYILAVSFERVAKLLPQLGFDLSQFEHSPITGIHLWFDRSITDLPHATLLDRNIQWMFNKNDGRHIQLVVSASRQLTALSRNEVVELAIRELAEFFPSVRNAQLEQSHVVKEVRATFSAKPGLGKHRPASRTAIPNLFLAGDYTDTGWPATMEGAVRSGYLAAEAATERLGNEQKFIR